MAKAKSKTRAANVRVPQSREEAAEFLRDIGVGQRQIGRIEADMNDAIAKAKGDGEAAAAPHKTAITDLTEGLRIWCEAHRSTLTEGGKVKSADLGTGTIAWRFKRASVKVTGPETVVDWLMSQGGRFKKFLRLKKPEVNKEAMLDDEELARTIPGIAIGSDGEQFEVEPFEAEIAGVAA